MTTAHYDGGSDESADMVTVLKLFLCLTFHYSCDKGDFTAFWGGNK